MDGTRSLRAVVAWAVLAAGGLAGASDGNASAGAPASTGPATVAVLGAELQRATGNTAKVALRESTGNATFIGATKEHPLQPADRNDDDPGQTARRFINRYGRMFGVADPTTDLAQSGVFTSTHGDAVRFQQRFHGVPVFAGQVAVQIDPNGAVVSTSGEASPQLSVDVTPTLSSRDAVATAVAITARSDGAAAAALTARAPELTVYDPALIDAPDPIGPRLVWKVQVRTALGDVDRLVLVDAQTGAIALHFSQVETGKQRDVCDNGNIPGASETCTSPLILSNGTGYAGASAEAQHAFDYAGQTYDFLLNTFGRDSLDGNGLFLHSTVRYCPPAGQGNCPYDNAFWNDEQMVYGDGYAAADDVVAHELTHGLTQFTSGLLYYADSGAINESMSDVIGEFVDRQTLDAGDLDWPLGEDLHTPGPAGFNGPLRSMKDPTIFNDPDSVLSSNFYTGLGDNRGVHFNSGVNNKAAYLIAQTDTPTVTFNGQTIRGLGITKAAKIYYQAETTLLGPGSDYSDLYNVLPQACINLIGSAGITADDCQQVLFAVTATAMNQHPATGGYYRLDPVCNGGLQNIVFHDDTAAANGNWVGSTTGGGAPWEYVADPSASGGKTLHVLDAAAPAGTSTLTGQTPIAIPAGTTFLRFDHSYRTDWDAGGLYDGGVVEYSTNNGGSWSDLGGLPNTNGYDAPIVNASFGGVTNPLAGRSAFGKASPNFQTSRYNLSSLAGQTIRLRFVFGTDNYPNLVFDGWFIDDITVYTSGPAQAPCAPGSVVASSTGMTSANVGWTVPTGDGGSAVTGYRITPRINGVAQTATETAGSGTLATFNNLTPGTTYTFTVAARNAVGLGPESPPSNPVITASPPPPPPPPPDFIPLTPARLLDSRSGGATVDGQFSGIGLRGGGTVTAVTVLGRGGVAGDAAAVALNVTVTDAQAPGYLTAYPCGGDPPTASNLNYRTGSTVPNAVISKIGANGQVCFFTQASVQLVVDVNGFFGATSSLVPIVPARLFDSRPGQPTADGGGRDAGQRGAGTVTEIQVTGRVGVPADASAAVLNVTVTDATAAGYATVYPCGGDPPTASNLNYTVGSTVPNAVVAKIGAGGKICVFTQSPIQLVVDVNGWFPAGSQLVSIVPARLIDTRSGQPTVDSQLSGIGQRPAGSVTEIQVTGRAGVPADATSVVLNVTVTEAQAPGYVTVYPCDPSPPNASNLNVTPGVTVANAVLAKLGPGGKVCVFTQSATHLVADIGGWFTG